MLSVAEAFEILERFASPLAAQLCALDELCGLRLAEAIASTHDSPPFDKSLVDGFAVSVADRSPILRVIELVTAGDVPQHSVTSGTAIRIMTGAPIPAGADAVVKWEDCRQPSNDAVENPALATASKLKPGDCILPRGRSFRAGEELLRPGKRLGALDVALLAEIGRPHVLAVRRPRVGVLATGDELVDADVALGPGQIRNSNGPMLCAAVVAAGAEAVNLGVARDEPSDLRKWISRGLEYDVLLVSGGVSAGVKDFVPAIFADLGAVEQFHQVRMKPGKPLWFGVRESTGRRTLVFGLPGNPVSTFVSFKLFVEPALAALAGGRFEPPPTETAVLTQSFQHRGGRPTYQPCAFVGEPGPGAPLRIKPLDWRGSADLATLTRAECLAVLPSGDYELEPGAEVSVLRL